jgi:hypothetical protein
MTDFQLKTQTNRRMVVLFLYQTLVDAPVFSCAYFNPGLHSTCGGFYPGL